MILAPRHTVKRVQGRITLGGRSRLAVQHCRWAVRPAGISLLTAGFAGPAAAHTTERGIVLLLPTEYYLAGGTMAVAASFLVLLLVPGRLVRRIAQCRIELCALPSVPVAAIRGIAFLVLVALIVAGLTGSRDPLSNPLPLTVWTLWWVGLTIVQVVLGNLWAVLNPWIAPYGLLQRLAGPPGDRPPVAYPARLGYWPAVAGLLGFAWFELIDPAPDDPARLAVAVAVYSAVTLVGMLLFGAPAWLGRAECFSVFFGFVARLAPLQPVAPDPTRPGKRRLWLSFPGAALIQGRHLPPSGVLFVLLTLAAVSFDGLSRTFRYLDLIGVNPLEFPGRSAVMLPNTIGLVAMWAALAAAYGLAMAVGGRLAGHAQPLKVLLGSFVLTILPISIGYHFAHYLTVFLVNGQYAVLSFADPFAAGWQLAGAGHRHVTVSFLADFEAVAIIWKLQAAGVVAGHVLAVLLAHMIAVERLGGTQAAVLSQIPLAVLMIGYTLFGLWLLAAPTAG